MIFRKGKYMTCVLTAMLVLVVCFCSPLILADEQKNPPNVIVILSDDLGYGDLGSYGSETIKTPKLDRMADEGVRLTNAYSSSSNCTPSRAGLLTGRYPVRTGMAHQVLFVEDTHGLPLEEVTIAEILKPKGYQTAIIGKWHLGHTPEHWPNNHGFDYYYGLPYSNNQFPLALYRNRQKIEEPVVQGTLTERYTQETIQFIERHQDKPFFIFLAHTAPHVPLFVSEKFEGRSRAALYGDVVETLDWSTGEILASLDRLGLEKNTLVIFTSDNGPYQGGSTAGLRGTKGTPWEGGYRVPFIARWPGQIPSGTSNDSISMNIDILPTISAITGAELPDDLVIDGKNLMPVLRGKQQVVHEKLYFFADEQIAAVRTQHWKTVLLVRYRGINRWLPDHDVRLLFNMDDDPYERYSLASHREDIWEQMTGYWDEGVEELESHAVHLNQQ
jgi:arylsulfatase A